MKKIICLLLFAGLMCSCAANTANSPDSSSLSAAANVEESSAIISKALTSKENLLIETTAAEKTTTEITTDEPVINAAIEDAESLSDEEIIELALGTFSSSDYIEDYTNYGSYNAVIIPEDEDFESYTSAFERFPVAYEEKYRDNVIEKLSENELYSEWINSYTEIRSYLSNNAPAELPIERSYRYFFLRNFRKTADGKLKYTGRLTAEDIKQNFDIFNKEIKIARKVSETDDSFIYDFYSVEHIVGDYGLCDRAELEHKQITVSKSDGVFSEPIVVYNKSVEIPETEYDEDIINCY